MTVHVTNIGDASATPATETIIRPSRIARRGIYRLGLKRMIDTALVLLSLPFVLPFCLLIAAALISQGASPFYRQERVGKDGKRFMMWKFRTMVPNADRCLADHLAADPAARIEWTSTQKLKNDPRCTPFGRVLRRTSMDELPQLLNVLSGDMALVGPRPMMPEQQSLYPGAAYYRLRPGITGYWQVSARNESEFVDRALYDDLYDETLSLGTDVRLLAQTANVVVRGTGY